MEDVTKEEFIKRLSNWSETDLEYLIKGIHNSNLQIPFSMGESRALNNFKDEFCSNPK